MEPNESIERPSGPGLGGRVDRRTILKAGLAAIALAGVFRPAALAGVQGEGYYNAAACDKARFYCRMAVVSVSNKKTCFGLQKKDMVCLETGAGQCPGDSSHQVHVDVWANTKCAEDSVCHLVLGKPEGTKNSEDNCKCAGKAYLNVCGT
jgi:hypothetical protein